MSLLFVVTGPTATGKTALGVELAKHLDGEVISADSMQLYRGMDIGTAKPDVREMDGVRHHMLDVAEPFENFSVARYAAMAGACVDDVLARGKTPIVVGGTGLYIEGLLRGIDYAAAPGDSGLRRALEAQYDELGGEAFRRKLAEVDPERAQKLQPGDKKRLVRALEVFALTGKTITCHDEESRKNPPRYEAFTVALDFADRQTLYDRIDRRVERMFEAGLISEVQALLSGGLSQSSTAIQAIGYKQTAAYLRGACTLQEAIDTIQRESRRYAKRQLTWLRRDEALRWVRWEKAPDMRLVRPLSTEYLHARAVK